MASKNLFRSAPRGQTSLPADAETHHGTPAYAMEPKHALAQFAVTGCFGNAYYVTAQKQLKSIIGICEEVDPIFIAKTAVYSRKVGYMKDVPAFLAAYLASENVDVLKSIFHIVIDNPKMLRNFVQIVRSNVTGRKSLGTAPKKMIQKWISQRSNEQLFRASVGNDPRLADIIKMVHPKPDSKEQEATFGYITRNKLKEESNLPQLIQHFESWKKDPKNVPIPSVPWEMLTAQKLDTAAWKKIAEAASWQMTRMNLNTFERHGVFKDDSLVTLIANRLRDKKEIERAKVFPYQLMVAYINYCGNMQIKEALQDAMEVATKNVPELNGNTVIAIDVSASMNTPITGQRGSATSIVNCIDVAAFFATCILRKNPLAQVLPFNGNVVQCHINPRDSIMTNTIRLSNLCNGGTNCSAPLTYVNARAIAADTIIFFSDNESWVDNVNSSWVGYGPNKRYAPAMMQRWHELKVRNPKAKMVCIDLVPVGTLQAKNSKDILNIGGFSDNVFDLMSSFITGNYGENYWVEQIEKIDIKNLDKICS